MSYLRNYLDLNVRRKHVKIRKIKRPMLQVILSKIFKDLSLEFRENSL